jgi:hypothetical protein
LPGLSSSTSLVGGGLPSLPLTPAHAESDPSIDLGKLIADTLSRLIQQRRAKTSVGIMPLKDDGKIAFEDFRSAVTSLGLASTEARRIFDHFDHENTGFIDFNELHAELTSRVIEKRSALPKQGKQAARLSQSPFGTVVGVRPPKKQPSSDAKLVSQGGIQQGLVLSRSAGSLMQPPSWDPVKGKLDAESFKQAPLWRAEAIEGSGRSKSLLRALASTGQLIRPSVKAQDDIDAMLKVRRESAVRRVTETVTVAKTKPLQSREEVFAMKSGEAEGFIGKIHDEELVEQQLNAATKAMNEKVQAVLREVASPFNTHLERALAIQSRVIEGRGNTLLGHANDVRATNHGLREAISKLRLERRLHVEFKEGLQARLTDLSKLVPALVDQCNVLLFEGEKVQTKVQQTHQDAMQQRLQQEEQLHDSMEQVARTEQLISKTQEAILNNDELHAQATLERPAQPRPRSTAYDSSPRLCAQCSQQMYTISKAQRSDEKTNDTKHGYLAWKTKWWVREFERLKEATGLQLDFASLAEGGVLDTEPITDMMERYSEKRADCESLERYLDSCTAQANTLDLALRKLRQVRRERDRGMVSASGSIQAPIYGGRISPSPVSHTDISSEMRMVREKLETVEAQLRQAFGPTASMLQSLVAPADFAAAVREAEAVREAAFTSAHEGWGATAEARATKNTTLRDDDDGEEQAISVEDTKVGGDEQDIISPAQLPKQAARGGRRSPRLPTGEAPSQMLTATAGNLAASHNSHRVRLLETALERLEHELLAVHDATRNFPKILDALAHPHKSTKERLPEPLKVWAGNPGDLEVKSVHTEFKRLAAEAEKRQREEAMREEAAAEEKLKGRSKGGLAQSKSVKPVVSKSGLDGSASMPS